VLSGGVANGLEDFNTLDVDDYGLSAPDIEPPNSSPLTDISSHLPSSPHGSFIHNTYVIFIALLIHFV
jgi:hypothetical protein